MTEQTFLSVLGSLILAGILWVLKTAKDTEKDVAVIKAIAVERQAEVEKLRTNWHALRDYMQEVETRLAVVEDRLKLSLPRRQTKIEWEKLP